MRNTISIDCPNCGKNYEIVQPETAYPISLYSIYNLYKDEVIECNCGTAFRPGGRETDKRTPFGSSKIMAFVTKMPETPRVKIYDIACKNYCGAIGTFLEWTMAICPKCGSQYTAYTTIPTEVKETIYSPLRPGLW